MVVDTSALIAFLSDEPEAQAIQQALGDAEMRLISAFNVFECRVVLGRRFGADMLREFELLLADPGIEQAPFDREQAFLAHRAYQRFGKGTGHPAKLNLGDCAAYALAKSASLPLLFKGGDFSQTDIDPVL